MGTTLTGLQIDNSYCGLIKTGDNGAIGTTPKTLSDGLGNNACIALGTAGTNFSGCVNFTGATVTGLPDNDTTYDISSTQVGPDVLVALNGSDLSISSVTLVAGTNVTLTDDGLCNVIIDAAGGGGGGGLVNGTGTASLKNDDSLVTTPAIAGGACSIVLGNGACSNNNNDIILGNGAYSVDDTTAFKQNIIIGSGAKNNSIYGGCQIVIGANAQTTTNEYNIVIGRNAVSCRGQQVVIGDSAIAGNGSTGYSNISIGSNSCTLFDESIAIGKCAKAIGGCSIAIGQTSCAQNVSNIAIGCGSCTTANNSQAIGKFARAFGDSAQALGLNAVACSNYAISIGAGSIANNVYSTAIGFNSRACATSAVAIGNAVTASTADTVTVCALQTCTASTPTAGGIIMTDAGSVARRINIDASGTLQIDSTPVGGGVTYDISSTQVGTDVLVALNGSDLSVSSVTLVAGTNITLTDDGLCNVTIDAAGGGGGGGLVNGTGTCSLKNDDSLVTTPAIASGNCSVALSSGAKACGLVSVSIGSDSCALGFANVAVGYSARSTGECAVVVGFNSLGSTDSAVSIGDGAVSCGNRTVAIGRNAQATNGGSIAMGNFSRACGAGAIGIGATTSGLSGSGANGIYSVYIGGGDDIPTASGSCSIAIGGVPASADRPQALCVGSIVIGSKTCSTAVCAVAIGYGVCASRASTVAGEQFEAKTVGKGIVVTSPDGLTTLGIGIDNTGAIVTYTP